MGKGACVHNHNNSTTIINSVEDEITIFGLPAFFSYPVNKATGLSSLNGKQKLKQIKNNNKKQKKQEKKLNQYKYLNIFEIDKNNISFSSSSDEEKEDDNGPSSSSSSSSSNTNNNNNNNNNFKESIENDELIINEEEEEKEEKEEEKIILTKAEEIQLYNRELAIEIENEDFEFIAIYESLSELIVYGEKIEGEMINKKRNDFYKRSCKKNKSEKVNADRWVKSIEQSKEDRKQYWLSFHYEREKDKTPKHIRIGQLSYNNNAKAREDSYESQLRKALSLSASEYDRQIKNSHGVPSLSQNQINDILNRELTPEDYELLLMLDESVKPKTVDVDDINRLPLVVFDKELSDKFNTCMVCLSDFDLGEKVTKLHCSHIFHVNCISNWLSLSSTKCPIDGISINN